VRAIRMHVAFECAHEPMYRSSLPPPDPYLESTVDSASQFGCFKPAKDLAFGKGSVDIADPMRPGQPSSRQPCPFLLPVTPVGQRNRRFWGTLPVLPLYVS